MAVRVVVVVCYPDKPELRRGVDPKSYRCSA